MENRDRRLSKRAIGVPLILGSVLIVLGYSIIATPQSATATGPIIQPSASLDVSLQHTPYGTAQLIWSAKHQALTVVTTLIGLAPGSSHAMSINQGSCGRTPDSGELFPLNSIVSIASVVDEGAPNEPDTTSSTTIPMVPSGIPGSGWFIKVYNAPSPFADKTGISCGDITNFDPSTRTDQLVNLTLGPTRDPNQAANGGATLSLTNNQLTVTVTTSGLAPGSTHQVSIRRGTCKYEGPMLYPLTPIVVDKNGNGTSTTTVPNVASIPTAPRGWYLSVHEAASAQGMKDQMGLQPLVCGNINS